MLRRTPLRRGKRKQATAEERRHLERVASLPCVVTGKWPVECHHVISNGFQRLTRDHKRVIPLSPEMHRDGPLSVHVLGRGFNEVHGIDQLEIADRLWRESEEIERGA